MRQTPRARARSALVRGDLDRDRLLLRVAAFLVAHAELEAALDLVRAGLVGRRLDRQLETRFDELVGVGFCERVLRELLAGRRLELELGREVGRHVIAGARRHRDLRDRLAAGLALGFSDVELSLFGLDVLLRIVVLDAGRDRVAALRRSGATDGGASALAARD